MLEVETAWEMENKLIYFVEKSIEAWYNTL